MPWISQIDVGDAEGPLKRQFDAALERAGRVWHIVQIMSLNPRTMKASMDIYAAIMFGRSPLTRVQRELLAVTVSAELGCHY